MKSKSSLCLFIYLCAIVLGSMLVSVATTAAESTELNEAAVKAYLEKMVTGDPGSCLVENMSVDIIGIGDLVPGQQAEVFYKYVYKLRCNRSKDEKSGQGVLKAVRLRNGEWFDREAFTIISK